MAQLIVTRRRQLFGRCFPPFAIVIDDAKAAPVRCGQTIGITLPPGRHEIQARIGTATSDSVQVKTGPDGWHHFSVGPKAAGWVTALQFLPMAWFLFIPMFSFGTRALTYFVVLPSVVSSFVVVFHAMYLVSGKTRLLDLKPLPGPKQGSDSGAPPCDAEFNYADLQSTLPVEPLRIRFTVRGIMIAVAVVAVLLSLGVGGYRNFRQAQYQRKAQMHAEIEAIWRKNERQQTAIFDRLKEMQLDSTTLRSSATRSAARADYHQAMRKKYERAAALGLLSVEPDPPEPPPP